MATIRLNLGCGLFPMPGVLNIDNDPTLPKQWEEDPESNAWFEEMGGTPQEIAFEARDPKDLSHLEAGSVEVVHVGYLLSEVEADDVRLLLGECHRVLRPTGGELVIQGLEDLPDLEDLVVDVLLALDFVVEDLRVPEGGENLVIGGDGAGRFVGISAFRGDTRMTFLGEPMEESADTDDWDAAEQALEEEDAEAE